MDAAKRYAVATHPKTTASMENSLPIAGKAILTDMSKKGIMKCPRATTKRAIFLLDVSVIYLTRSSYKALAALSQAVPFLINCSQVRQPALFITATAKK